jgi:hypothetical protein
MAGDSAGRPDRMSEAQRAQLVRAARAVGLVAVAANGQLQFFAENPIDPKAPPYFSSVSPAECHAFIAGWHMREYDVNLRVLARERALQFERTEKAKRLRRQELP